MSNSELALGLYDKLFIQYGDALKLVDSEIQNNKKANVATAAGKKKAEDELKSLEQLTEYLTYSRVSRTLERNLLLVDGAVNRFTEFGAPDLNLMALHSFVYPHVSCRCRDQVGRSCSDER